MTSTSAAGRERGRRRALSSSWNISQGHSGHHAVEVAADVLGQRRIAACSGRANVLILERSQDPLLARIAGLR